MKQSKMLTRLYASVMIGALVMLGFSAAPTFAQDNGEADQEHREQFNEALETAREGQAAREGQDFESAYTHFSEARDQFLETAQLAEANDDPEVTNMAYQRAAQMAYFSGQTADALERHEDALEQFEAGIEADPNYAQNYLGRAVALRKMDRMDEAIEAYAEAMETGNNDVSQNSEQAIRQIFHHRASQLLGQETVRSADANQAMEYLQEMQDYVDASANTYFYLAVAQEALGNMSEAIDLSTQALDMHTGSRTDRARIHLIRGEAYLAAGNTGEACQDFEEANVGDFQQRAQHHLEHSCE